MNQDAAPDRAVAGLRAVVTAVVDTSSIIYMIKAGFLERLAFSVDLIAPPEVAAETGWPRLPVRTVATAIDPLVTGVTATPDDAVLALARDRRIPVISEDRELLLRAEEAGMPYYNALMMLNLLADRGRCNAEEYALFRNRLEEIGRYSREVLAFAADVARVLGVPRNGDVADGGA
ncbi:MAG: hypothetical protein ACOCYG_05880 [Spirochaetota bacterium]